MAAPGDRKQRILAVAHVSHVLTREVMMDRCMKTRTRTRSEDEDIPAAGCQHSPAADRTRSRTRSPTWRYTAIPGSINKNKYKDDNKYRRYVVVKIQFK